MNFKIYDNEGQQINTIHASIQFVENYCNTNGYTYEQVADTMQDNEIVENLKKQLADGDYKIIKCMEAQLCGETMPYDVEQLHSERQTLREQINAYTNSL